MSIKGKTSAFEKATKQIIADFLNNAAKEISNVFMSTGDCMWIDEFSQMDFDFDIDSEVVSDDCLLYCKCEKPDTILDNAGGNPFYFCKLCKKEWQKPDPPIIPW